MEQLKMAHLKDFDTSTDNHTEPCIHTRYHQAREVIPSKSIHNNRIFKDTTIESNIDRVIDLINENKVKIVLRSKP